MTNAEIDHRFAYHPPLDVKTADAHGHVRTICANAALDLKDIIASVTGEQSSRELSLAVTALEEAMMWANAAIARNQPKPAELRAA